MPGIIPPGHPMLLPSGGGLPIPSGVKAALLNVLTLGAYQHPHESGEYWKDLAKEFDPRKPQDLIALGATIFGPRLDEPIVSPRIGPDGMRVPLVKSPLPKLEQRVNLQADRNLRIDTARPVIAKVLRTNERLANAGRAHVGRVSKRMTNVDPVETAHDLAENNEQTHPLHVPRDDIRLASPAQLLLLKRLLGHHLA